MPKKKKSKKIKKLNSFPTVIVGVEGGLVQWMYANAPVRVIVQDIDVKKEAGDLENLHNWITDESPVDIDTDFVDTFVAEFDVGKIDGTKEEG